MEGRAADQDGHRQFLNSGLSIQAMSHFTKGLAA